MFIYQLAKIRIFCVTEWMCTGLFQSGTTAFSFKKYCLSLVFVVKILISMRNNAEASPWMLLLIVRFLYMISLWIGRSITVNRLQHYCEQVAALLWIGCSVTANIVAASLQIGCSATAKQLQIFAVVICWFIDYYAERNRCVVKDNYVIRMITAGIPAGCSSVKKRGFTGKTDR